MTFEEIDKNLDMIAERTFQCPRCLGPIPNAEHRGEYSGALSRVADVEVCSDCGTHEAMQPLMFGKRTTPRSQWPIKDDDLNDLRTCSEMNRQAREAAKRLKANPNERIIIRELP